MRVRLLRHYPWKLASGPRADLGLRFLDSKLRAPEPILEAAQWFCVESSIQEAGFRFHRGFHEAEKNLT